MSKITKRSLYITLIVFISGIVLFFLGFALLEFDYTKLDTSLPYTEKYYEQELDAIETIEIQSVNHAIIVKPSRDNKIHITYYEKKNSTYQIKKEEHQLTMTNQIDYSFWKSFQSMFQGITDGSKQVIVEIPSQYQHDVILKTTNASIKIEDAFSFHSLTMTSTNGSLKGENISSEILDIKSTNGSIQLENCQSTSSNIHTTNGAIKIENSSIQSLMIDSMNGGIHFQNLNVDKLDAHNTNGGVKGNIKGSKKDYSIHTSKVNGSSNLDNQINTTSKKEIRISTVNGSIKVTFDH